MKKLVVAILIALIGVIIAGSVIVKKKAESEVKTRIDSAIQKLSPYVSIKYSDISVSLLSQSLAVSHVTISSVDDSKYKLEIDKIILSDFALDNMIPVALKISVKGVNGDLDSIDQDLSKSMKKLGYNNSVKLNYSFMYDFNKDKHTLRLSTGAGVDEVGEVELSLNVADLYIDFPKLLSLTQNWSEIKDSLNLEKLDLFQNGHSFNDIKFSDVSLKYNDKSLIGRVYKNYSESSKMDVASLKNMLVGSVQMMLPSIGEENINNIKSFIDDPKNIKIIIKAKNPMSFAEIMQLRDPSQINKNFTVSTSL